MRVLVVGSYNLDRVFECQRLPAAGATVAASYREGPGGKGFNQAVAARRLGAEVYFLAAIGHDEAGAQACRLAASEGIHGDWVESEAPTGTAGIFLEQSGANAIAVALGANLSLSAEEVARRMRRMPPFRVLITQLEIPLAAASAALAHGRERGAITLLDPAPPRFDRSLLALASLIKPNEAEFLELLRQAGEALPETPLTALPDEPLHALCRRLAPGSVLLTLGAHGVFVSHGERRFGDEREFYRIHAAPATVRDTVAAGDAFAGALAAFLAMQPEAPLAAAVAFATRVAARKTERPGAALAMPRREEIE
ncbi:MAG: ribokinase [Lysobacterales bacterium]|jgi:ribokinase|nr:MAG: ribokinase [Xanthomonadales bacterium]